MLYRWWLNIHTFLHDRPWISPWTQSISNELDITIHVIASQLSRYCDIIRNRLWRHQQNEDRASKARGRCVKVVVFIFIYGFVMSYKKWNNVCILVPTCCFTTRELNKKVTLSWAQRQFLTRVHTLFSLYAPCRTRCMGRNTFRLGLCYECMLLFESALLPFTKKL